MLINEQSCMENGVTNPDHPVFTQELKNTGLPVSTANLPTPTRVGLNLSTGSSVSSATRGEEIPNLISRITNKWIRFGVPLVGCGEWSEVAYGKLQGTVSAYMQSLD